MLKKSLIKKSKYILSLAGGYILFLVIKKAGWNNIIGILSTLSPFFVCLVMLSWISNLVIGALRFKRFLSSNLRFLEIFEIYLLAGLLNYAAPIQGLGIGARVGMLKMKKISVSRTSAGIGAEVIYDISLSILISIIGLAVYTKAIMQDFLKIVNFNPFVLPAILGVLVLIGGYFLRKNEFIKNFLKNVFRSFSSANLPKNSLISLGLYATGVLMSFFVYKAMGITINPLLLFFAGRISYLFGLSSFIPGGLGVRDAVSGYVCSLAGIPIEVTLSLAVIIRFISLASIAGILLIINIFRKCAGAYSNPEIKG